MAPSAPIPLSSLANRLGLDTPSLVSLVGGGGKTTLLHALAAQLPGSVLATTTTKMSSDQTEGMTVLLDPSNEELGRSLDDGQPILAWRRIDGTKAIGFDAVRVGSWIGIADHVIVEADGSRRRPFKAPGPLEPAVPDATTDLVSVIGVDAIGRVILDQCHRPLRVAGLAGCQPGERLSPVRAATVLLHPDGMRRALPDRARFHIVITKVEDTTDSVARGLAGALEAIEPAVNVVLVLDAGSSG